MIMDDDDDNDDNDLSGVPSLLGGLAPDLLLVSRWRLTSPQLVIIPDTGGIIIVLIRLLTGGGIFGNFGGYLCR